MRTGGLFLLGLLAVGLIVPGSAVKMVESESCKTDMVETMPDGLRLSPPTGVRLVSTSDSWLELIESAKTSIKVASMYWFLSAELKHAQHPSAAPGRRVMDAISRAVKRGVKLEVILSKPGKRSMNNDNDIRALEELGSVKYVNVTKLIGGGILHSKFIITDERSFYVGSANLDWRALSHVKEMGLTFKDCPNLARDLDKVFSTYKLVAGAEFMPHLTGDLKTAINKENPIEMNIADLGVQVYLSGTPPAFDQDTGRTDDIDALLSIIDSAHSRIDISVMNYSPRTEFKWPKQYWPVIDDALRRVAVTQRVRVRLLFGTWANTRSSELAWYRSLNGVRSTEFGDGGIEVRLFRVPAFDDFQKSVPFARVKHDKYMVTDSSLYIGNNNWTPDYFMNTAGVCVIIRANNPRDRAAVDAPTSIIRNFADIFERDWNSEYALTMEEGEKDWTAARSQRRSYGPSRTALSPMKISTFNTN